MSNEVKRYGVSGPDWEVGEEPDGEFALWSDYADLEAECSRLRESLKDADAGMVLFLGQRNELAAQLAAIQQAKGEEVEVVGYAGRYQLELRHLYPQYPGMKIKKEPNERYTDALMTVAQHQRIVVAMAAELEKARNGFPAMVEYVEEIAQLRAELEAARKQEPFWYAVVSERAPVINKAIRRGDVAQEYADKCSEHYQGVEVVPLYRLPPLAGQVAVPRELLQTIEQSWRVPNGWPKSVPDHAAEKIESGLRELRALLATPSMEVKS